MALLCLAYLLKCPSNQVGGKGWWGGWRWFTPENTFLYREADCPAREEYLFHWLQESIRYIKGPLNLIYFNQTAFFELFFKFVLVLSISFQREAVFFSRYLKGVPWNIKGIGYRCGAFSCQTLFSNPPPGLEFLLSSPSLGETSVIRAKKIWQSLHEQYYMPT